jgi:hypothetical protein
MSMRGSILQVALRTSLLLGGVQAFQSQLDFTLDAKGCVPPGEYNDQTNYFPPQRQAMGKNAQIMTRMMEAKDFSIQYEKTYKIVRNSEQIKDTKKVFNMIWVLSQCGTPPPTEAELKLTAPDAVNAPVFVVPVPSTSTASTVPIGFLDALSLGGDLVYTNMDRVSSPCQFYRADCGALDYPPLPRPQGWSSKIDANGEGDTKNNGTHVNPNPNFNWKTTSWPSAVDASGSKLNFIDTYGTGATGTDIDVAFDPNTDPSLLGRSEWTSFVAAFWNQEAHGNRVNAAITAAFEGVSNAAIAAGITTPNPTTVIAYQNWDGTLKIDQAIYYKEIIIKSGGKYLPNDQIKKHCSDGPTPANPEGDFTCTKASFIKVLRMVEVLVDRTYFSEAASTITQEMIFAKYGISQDEVKAADFPFLAQPYPRMLRDDHTIGKYFPESKREGSDWFEEAAVRPDVVILDFFTFIMPIEAEDYMKSKGETDRETLFVRNVANSTQANGDWANGPILCDRPTGRGSTGRSSAFCPVPQLPHYVNGNECKEGPHAELHGWAICPGDPAWTLPEEYNFCLANKMCTFIGPSPPSPATPPAPATPPSTGGDDDDGLSAGIIAAIVVLGVLVAATIGSLTYVIAREKKGKPMFAEDLPVESAHDEVKKGGEKSVTYQANVA